jgi:formylglycine-generating enzyme required for sulfatase activity
MTDKKPQRVRALTLVACGALIAVLVLMSFQFGMEATSTDAFCDKACHVHPEATQTWIKSTHFTTKSGVVTHCVECHLPAGGVEYYTEKARLGAQDIYGKLFKDVSKIDWVSKRSLERAKTFTYDSACIRCHQNLFSKGLSKKGADGHLHYQRQQPQMKCINCHLHSGHYRGEVVEEPMDVAETQEKELDQAFPLFVEGFANYAEMIPGSEVKFRMVAVPGGTFEMGSPPSEPFRRPDEGPQRKVRLSPFWMGRAEVSWREYEVYLAQRGTKGRQRDEAVTVDAVTGPTPPYGSPDQGWGRGSRPAITMTHYAATKYCEWLSEVTGKKYRLPTEAEWEYACRAGTTSPYFFAGDPTRFTTRLWLNRLLGAKTEPIAEYVRYVANSHGRSHPPYDVRPNPWGLVHMLGNVKEFCLDWYDPESYAKFPPGEEVVDPRGPASGEEHVIRGGSFRSDAADLRAAARDHTRHNDCLMTDPQSPKSIWWYSDCTDIGFRVVREYTEGETVAQQGREKKRQPAG